jgi:hypothetical protein
MWRAIAAGADSNDKPSWCSGFCRELGEEFTTAEYRTGGFEIGGIDPDNGRISNTRGFL